MADPQSRPAPGKVKRPTSVTWLALLVLIITGLNLVRFGQALAEWELLTLLPGVDPRYLAVTGLVWGLLGLPVSFGLWRGMRFARSLALIFALLYTAYSWIDLLAVAKALQDPTQQASLPFKAAQSLMFILFTFWTLMRAKAAAFFRRNG